MPISSKNLCLHTRFGGATKVNYLDDVGRWIAEITIECEQCGEKFRWSGVPSGFDVLRPMSSIDGLELRAPIEPQGDKVMLASRSAFHVPAKKVDREIIEETIAIMREAVKSFGPSFPIQPESVTAWANTLGRAIRESIQ